MSRRLNIPPMTDNIIFITPHNDFLRPYIERETGKNAPLFSVMVSSTDIYIPDEEAIINEDGEIDENSEWYEFEKDFLNSHPEGIILRAAPITGTGMTGKIRQLTEEIYRARFFHFPGNEARKSIVHATDVAQAVAYFAMHGAPDGGRRIFNICDGTDPTLHDIAEALAFRLGNKRISNLSTRPQQLIGRFLYGKRYAYYSRSERYNGGALRAATGLEPVDVCNYLRTHVYDENSI